MSTLAQAPAGQSLRPETIPPPPSAEQGSVTLATSKDLRDSLAGVANKTAPALTDKQTLLKTLDEPLKSAGANGTLPPPTTHTSALRVPPPLTAKTTPGAADGTADMTVGSTTAAAAGGSAAAERVPASAGTGAYASSSQRAAHPAAVLMHQHKDRMVMFLVTLVTYPFAFLMTQAAATAGAVSRAAVGGGVIDTRKRLQDFPEGAAIADLESWCREPVYSSWVSEVFFRTVVLIREMLLTYLNYDIVQQVLSHPKLLQVLGINGRAPLTHLVDQYMSRARQLLEDGSPHLALVELQTLVLPSIESIKSRLEQRYTLERGPTPLERLDFITNISRTTSRLFFAWLRGLARLCTYISGLLSVISGALSFTVVPSIILSVFSAAAGVAQLVLTGTADLLEPAVNGVLALTETGKNQAASIAGSGSPVCSRRLPAATVEQLENFFENQLTQVSGLLNRPEIPKLAGLNKSLLVKAYDLGLIDALGRTEGPAVRQLLQTAQDKGVLHTLIRGGSKAAVAAANFDVMGVVAAAQELAGNVYSGLAPALIGGGKGNVKKLFRPDGFFAYADDRQAQVGLVLLCRLLSWLHLASVVAPGSPNCVRFVLIMGQAQSGKASLFTQLVAAPAELAAQLGGGAAYGAESTAGEGKKAPSGGIPNSSGVSGLASAAVAGGAAAVDAAAVDIRPVSGQSNMYCCVFPGLNSKDVGTSRLSQALAQALGGLASAVVYLVHPSTEPTPDQLEVLWGPLAAGRHVLVAINGPSRVKGLTAAAGGTVAGLSTEDAAGAGPVLPAPSTPLETLRSRWQSAAEAFCAQRGLTPSLLGVVVSELQHEGEELPAGVHKFKQVQEWVISTANHAHRMA